MSDRERMMASYRDQYGSETEALFDAMMTPQDKIALINPFIENDAQQTIVAQARERLPFGAQFASLPKDLLPISSNSLLSHYFLDLSSIFAPLLLPIIPHARVLDMCAAPGGKLLVMLSRTSDNVTMIANDISSTRAERLRRVVKDFVPLDRAAHVMVTHRDAISFGLREPARYDAVLLDAPCSSEAHVVRDDKLLKQFKGLRKTLPQRQYALLAAALLAVKPGGYVMYATCSINKLENEGVVAKALQRTKTLCEIVSLDAPIGLKSEFGVTILPHLHGAGPAFFSLLKKR